MERVRGDLPNHLCGGKLQSLRLTVQGVFLVLELDVILAGGVSENYLRATAELWDRLLQEFLLFLRANASAEAGAEDAGADTCINPNKQKTVDVVKKLTSGNGVDVMIEYSGAAESLELAADCVTPGGELRLVGVPGGNTAIHLEKWLLRGLVVRNIHGRRLHHTWEHATRLVAEHKVDLSMLVSHVLPLEEGQRGFDLINNGEAIKVLFQPN